MQPEEVVVQFLPMIIMLAFCLIFFAMFFAYRILKLIVAGKKENVAAEKKKNGKFNRKDVPPEFENMDIDQLLQRCMQLNQRVQVLEEIMAADKDKVSTR